MKMNKTIRIQSLTKEKFKEAVNLVLKAKLDTRKEIEHHLEHIEAHDVAVDKNKIVGVIGWYQDTVDYATKAMGDIFPGTEAYWVGFFVVDKKYQGQGIGYALISKLEQVIKGKGATQLWVSSVPETKDYYKRQGFEIVMQGKIGGNPKFFMVKKF